MNKRARALLLLPAAALSVGTAPRSHELDSSYGFDEYLQHFDKSYPDAVEYRRRKERFTLNMEKILNHNKGRLSDTGDILGGGYVMGVNHLTDQNFDELPFGYDKTYHSSWSGQLTKGASKIERMLGESKTTSYSQPLDFQMKELSSLPESVDWSAEGHVNPTIPQQGGCGSCWTFALTATVESHLSIATNEPPLSLSEQSVLQCTPNPDHCGGTGGCEGSTVEIGLNYIADLTAKKEGGMYNLSDVPYSPSSTQSCEDVTKDSTASVGVTGWTQLPTNDLKATLNAVAQRGPVAIAAAAGDWALYEKGVFTPTSNDAKVNHAILLVGYGIDEDTGEKYYKIRNSWGPGFGEEGYIRVLRNDEDSSNCKMDDDPLVGLACALDDSGNKIDVQPVKVCGVSGVLFDVSYPIGVHKIDVADQS